MKKYIILSYCIGNIGGAQIFNRNKMKYCQAKGDKVFIFSAVEMPIYIKDFEKYKKLIKNDLRISPNIMPKSKKKEVIEWFKRCIEYKCGDEIFIESQTIEMALWGEYFAKACNSKNFCYLLGEDFNDVHKAEFLFLDFKRKRRELAFIKNNIMDDLFSKFLDETNYKAISLPAICANSVENIELPDGFVMNTKAINVAIVGRVSKPYVEKGIRTVVKIAEKHRENYFVITVIGGGTRDNIDKLYAIIEQINNVSLKVTGYIYPIPEKMIQLMDLCIAGAGSATAICTYCPTISVDVIKCEALGILGLDTQDTVVGDNLAIMSMYDYIENILFHDFLKGKIFNYPPQPTRERIDMVLDSHFEYYSKSVQEKVYYMFNSQYSIRRIIFKIVYGLAGTKGVIDLKNRKFKSLVKSFFDKAR